MTRATGAKLASRLWASLFSAATLAILSLTLVKLGTGEAGPDVYAILLTVALGCYTLWLWRRPLIPSGGAATGSGRHD